MKTTLIMLLFCLPVIGQEAVQPFSSAVRKNIRKYNTISSRAYEAGDLEKGQYLFDTLVTNQLAGTKFDDYKLRKVSGGRLKLSSIKKPVLIQTYASWCVMNKGEIPALNKLARQYSKDLQIVVVFWDKRQHMKNIAQQFSSSIEICYANENTNKDEEVVATLKYAIGYLTSYYLDEQLRVVSIKKGALRPAPKKTPIKECIKLHFDSYNTQIANLLLASNIGRERIATKYD